MLWPWIMWDICEWYLLFYGEQYWEWVFSGKPAWLLHLPWKEASNTQLQSWLFQNVTVQTGKQHTMNSFIIVGVFYWTAVIWKELLPVSSLGHLDCGSMSYDLGLYGTSISGICYFMAEQYWEAWRLSESVVFHVFYLVSCWFLGFCWCLFWVLLFCVFVAFWWHLGSRFTAEHPCRKLFDNLSCLSSNVQHLHTFGTKNAFPLGRLTCVLSALPTSPWSNYPRNRLHYYPPALSGRLHWGWRFLFNSLSSQLLLSRKYTNFESDIATLSFVFADRRATARTTTFVEPCSIQIKKKTPR